MDISGLDGAVWGSVLELRAGLPHAWALWWAEIFRPRWVVLYAAVLSLFLWWRRSSRWLFPALAVLSATVIGHLLKMLIARPRPPAEFRLAVEETFAMPSGHAIAVFSLAMVITLGFRAPAWLRWLVWLNAFGVAFLRLYLGVHWFSDVLVGAALGVLLSWLCWRLCRGLGVGGGVLGGRASDIFR
ncbi:phosphatase PAP2 family protein [Corynebacterium sp. A21]|uniref:phosphatase PAP2 family protein n=1 Tax=Corynebacterium sp. A21 TaxID=3457318 RepID=UPI003FD10F1D